MTTPSPENPPKQNPLPPLKPGVEAVQIEHEGKPIVLLKDTEGLADKGLGVSMAGFFIATMLDGRNTIGQIQAAFSKASGKHIPEADIQALIQQLDQAHLLETKELGERRKKIYQEFRESPVHEPHHVNTGYPEDKLKLAEFLGKFFKDPKGPGKEFVSAPTQKEPPLLFVSPHIDFYRGGTTYAHTYQALSDYPVPDVVIGLGVAHMTPNSPWVMSPKDFITPYGPMKYDQPLYEKIEKVLWYDGREEEWVHRTEHSLEFQALWLKYLWREKSPPWVPILCSSFDRFTNGKAPSAIDSMEKAIKEIGDVLKTYQDQGKKVMLVAGIDLAHVGYRFGDKEEMTPELREKIKTQDQESIDLALQGKADEFYLSVTKEEHWRKWCGLSAFYTALRLMEMLNNGSQSKGQLIQYDQADDPAGGVVSFMGGLFPRSS